MYSTTQFNYPRLPRVPEPGARSPGSPRRHAHMWPPTSRCLGKPLCGAGNGSVPRRRGKRRREDLESKGRREDLDRPAPLALRSLLLADSFCVRVQDGTPSPTRFGLCTCWVKFRSLPGEAKLLAKLLVHANGHRLILLRPKPPPLLLFTSFPRSDFNLDP